MRLIRFGNSGLVVSEVGLGTRSFGESIDETGCMRVLDRYEDVGGNLIDTAVTYAGGRSEEILGQLLAGSRRDRFVLSTKFGVRRNERDANAAGASRRNLRRSLDESLRRLRTDHVDILWLHAWHPGLPADEFLRSVRDEIARGRVLNVGMSNAPAWWISRLHTRAEERGWEPLAGIQVEYSLGRRDAEHEFLPMATELDLGVLAWSPLGRGCLVREPRCESELAFSAAENATWRQLRKLVVDVARITGTSPAAVATSWVVNKGVIPLIGARTAAHIDELAVAITSPLTSEHQQELDRASCPEPPSLNRFLREVRIRVDPCAASSVGRTKVDGNSSPHDE
ncbi:MAG: aldo/keto reductase [Pseudonocardiaceae bacterium]